MAQGTLKLFEEFALYMHNGEHDLSSVSDYSLKLYSSTIPVAALVAPDSGLWVECTAGGGYSTGGVALTTSYAEAGGVGTFDSSTNPVWTSTGTGGPADIRFAAIIDTNAGATVSDAIGWIDMTTDGGTTPIDLDNGDITVTFGANIFAATITP